ncbi:MAG: HAMP domain-containing histidine kinase [Gemmataceae bacterium]|nr:HAMP domain-containing histidine kinase [Gemmataceae bacterium]
MACQWRIRYKLLLGLGFAVAIVALLLGGALKGLLSYRTTIRTVDLKLVDLKHAIELRTKLRALAEPNNGPPNRELIGLQEKVLSARETLGGFEQMLKESGRYGEEPEKSYKVTPKLEALAQRLGVLDGMIRRRQDTLHVSIDGALQPLLEDPLFNKNVRELSSTVDEVIGDLFKDCYDRFDIAKKDAHFSLLVVIVTSAVGVLLMAGLLRFFYRWTFYPIRDLQAGVSRVGQGDFDHLIEIHSGDEIEELAARFNDMTARLRDMYRDLARQVNERSRQLVRSERLAGVGFLAAGVAHEINNPLASVVFCSEALGRRLLEVLERFPLQAQGPDSDVEVIAKYLRMIQQEALRCKEITQRLLEFSRGGERRREATDLCELTQGVLDVAQHLQTCKGKKVTFDPPARLVAWVNAQEVKQVVLNLVVNALDSMDEGGTLTIALSQRDGMAELMFSDTGCGMTAEVLENIFEPFFTRSRTGKGTGLGLSISHRIISQHQGEIEAVSGGPGQGSTFTVRLPLQPTESARDSEQEPGAAEQDWSAQRKAA